MTDVLAQQTPNSATSTVLEFRNLWKLFGGVPALDDVSFSLERGKIHALLGGNGSGKSTTIKILAGVYEADGGRISLGTSEYAAADITPTLVRDAGVRFVHQQSSTFPDLTIAENLFIGRGFDRGAVGNINWRAANRRAQNTLDRFHIQARPTDLLNSLSLANQTMVAIARALQDLGDESTGLLVLDEPTSALPPAEVDRLLTSLHEFARRGQTIMYVTHRLDEVVKIADSATILRDGKVASSISRADITHDRLVELIMGRPVESVERPRFVHDRDVRPILTVRGASAGPVDRIDLDLYPGEIVGIAGLLGSGRSTILKGIFGLVPWDAGTLQVAGKSFTPKSARMAMSNGIAYVPENRAKDAAFAEMTITENLGIATTGKYFNRGFLNHRRERRDARDLMKQHLIKASAENAPISTLSGGNQQKVIVARWLRQSPRILLLDEPSQGVDVGARQEIWSLIRSSTAAGAAALVVSSDFEELATFCDRALVLRGGRFVGEHSAAELTAHQLEHSLLRSEENR